jgi:hypothetical protein
MLRALLTEKSSPGHHHHQQRQQPAVGHSPQIRDQRSAERTSRYDFTYVGQEYDGLPYFPRTVKEVEDMMISCGK